MRKRKYNKDIPVFLRDILEYQDHSRLTYLRELAKEAGMLNLPFEGMEIQEVGENQRRGVPVKIPGGTDQPQPKKMAPGLSTKEMKLCHCDECVKVLDGRVQAQAPVTTVQQEQEVHTNGRNPGHNEREEGHVVEVGYVEREDSGEKMDTSEETVDEEMETPSQEELTMEAAPTNQSNLPGQQQREQTTNAVCWHAPTFVPFLLPPMVGYGVTPPSWCDRCKYDYENRCGKIRRGRPPKHTCGNTRE